MNISESAFESEWYQNDRETYTESKQIKKNIMNKLQLWIIQNNNSNSSKRSGGELNRSVAVTKRRSGEIRPVSVNECEATAMN